MDIKQLQQGLRAAEDSYLLLKSRRDAAIKHLAELEAARDAAIRDIDICAKLHINVEDLLT